MVERHPVEADAASSTLVRSAWDTKVQINSVNISDCGSLNEERNSSQESSVQNAEALKD